MHRYSSYLRAGLLLWLVVAPVSAAEVQAVAAGALQSESASTPRVVYQPESDRLGVDADGASLTLILAEIAAQSGTEILIDPAVERRVTSRFSDQTLEEGLKTLTRGLNSVMVYADADATQTGKAHKLIGMKLLAAGQTDTSRLQPVSSRLASTARSDGENALSEKVSADRSDRVAMREAKQQASPARKAREDKAERTQSDVRPMGKAARLQAKEEKLLKQMARLEEIKLSQPERYQRRFLATQQRLNEVQQARAGLASN